MKEYKDFSADDFITDDRFVRWVRFQDHAQDEFWSDFMKSNPAKVTEIDEARQFLVMLGSETVALPAEKLTMLHQHINDRLDTPVSASTVHQIVTSRSRANRMYAYAALILVTVITLVSWWMLRPLAPADRLRGEGVVAESGARIEEYVIPKGKRSRILLEDGTQVWLNADSKLEYGDNFLDGKTREVTLKGEAFFEVTPDRSRPFIVHIQGVDIKVLGTAFNVKGYDGELKVEATLVHGKISVAGKGDKDQVTLAANQRAVFLKERKKVLVENNVETDNYTSWRKGVLVFEDQPVAEILPILERTFDVTIHTEDATALDCRFTAKINNKSLQEVLELFKTSDTIMYEIIGNEVFIKGSFCEE
jgi:transmembrane sensor